MKGKIPIFKPSLYFIHYKLVEKKSIAEIIRMGLRYDLFWISHDMPSFQSDFRYKIADARCMCFISHSTNHFFIRKSRES